MRPFLNDSDRDWQEFGETDPYFAVLSAPEYHGRPDEAKRAEFFRSGETHIDRMVAIIRASLDPAFAPATALDFGCGVGRLLIPLAARCGEVTGVDISAAMLAEARRNCLAAGISNFKLLPSDDRLSAVTGQFDFVHSYIVLQHIPVARGEQIVRALAARIATNGVGMFHVTYTRLHKSILSRVLYWIRTKVPAGHFMLNLLMRRPARAALMQINRYSVTSLLDILYESGCNAVHVRFSDHGGNRGVLLFARKGNEAVFT